MKNLNTLAFLFVLLGLTFISCKKDSEVIVQSDLDKYFSLKDATLENEAFPEATSADLEMTSFYTNDHILAGGSNIISFSATDFSSVLLGIDGETGYYKIAKSALTASDGKYTIPVFFTQSIDGNLQFIVALQDESGNVGTPMNTTMALVAAGTGQLQVSLSWDQLNDVDLHLVLPDSQEIFWGNFQTLDGGFLDVDSNPACMIDSINNENITFDTDVDLVDGQYIVRVDFYQNCTITVPTNYTVTAYYGGALVIPTEGENPYTGVFDPNEWDQGNLGSGVTIMKFDAE